MRGCEDSVLAARVAGRAGVATCGAGSALRTGCSLGGILIRLPWRRVSLRSSASSEARTRPTLRRRALPAAVRLPPAVGEKAYVAPVVYSIAEASPTPRRAAASAGSPSNRSPPRHADVGSARSRCYGSLHPTGRRNFTYGWVSARLASSSARSLANSTFDPADLSTDTLPGDCCPHAGLAGQASCRRRREVATR